MTLLQELSKKLFPNNYISKKQQILLQKLDSEKEFNDDFQMSKSDFSQLLKDKYNYGLHRISRENSIKKYCKIEYHCQDYYYGLQINYNKPPMRIFCFRDLLVIDWDNMNLNEIYNVIPEDLTFRIYETRNGYHGYCINKKFDSKNLETQLLMKELKCDLWYIAFSFNYGYVTRISNKNNDELFVEKYIDTFGNNIDSLLLELVLIKDKVLEESCK